MISAKEARAQLDSSLNEAATKEIEAIEKKITEAVRKNQSSIRLTELSDITKVKLKDNGYQVKYFSGAGDQRDWNPSYYTISF